jgi:Domain of unknown function (DUF4188)
MIKGRLTARADGEFVLFLIGMRFNKWWRVDKWGPIFLAMPRMLRELYKQREFGLLHHEMWFGRTLILVQYWRSSEQLLAYANAKDAAHLPAWKAFNQAITDESVGLWHETYVIKPGQYENIYANMPRFGLGAAMGLREATGTWARAATRLTSEN